MGKKVQVSQDNYKFPRQEDKFINVGAFIGRLRYEMFNSDIFACFSTESACLRF